MKKIFISHSSADKEHYVRPLVDCLIKNIGKDKIVYDELTFEAGAETISEIRNSMDYTDLFVLLISKKSLESEWVQKEIGLSKKLKDNYDDSQRILPVIIDNRVDFKDKSIPDWLREYNLRPVYSPKKLSRMIFSRVMELSWSENAFLKAKNTLFVGRNSEMESFENRINDFDVEKTNVIIASGLPSVGRRSFIKKGLQKVGIIRESYTVPVIILDGHQSIEDFIREVQDLIDEPISSNLIAQSVEEKIQLAFNLLIRLTKLFDDKLFIDDRGAIVTHTGEISPWFSSIIELFKDSDLRDISVCVLSRYKPFKVFHMRNVYHIHIDALKKQDVTKLLNQYSKLHKIDFEKSELRDLSPHFSGFPKEIFYALDLIMEYGKDYLYKNTDLIHNFSDNNIQAVISGFRYSANDEKILKIISKFNFINIETLFSIVDYASIPKSEIELEKYIRHGLLNKIGADGEYVVLNLAVKNYYERQIHLDNELEDSISKFVETVDLESDDISLSDEMFAMQEKLKAGKKVPFEKLIPSYYLKTMKYLYDNRKNSEVVNLADTVLESSDILDGYIRDEIAYFLCSSLARLKRERFKHEVQYFYGGFKYNFLFGFYYRQIGKFKLAIDKFNQVLQDNHTYSQAKRELVLLYNKIGEYELAYSMAKDNYDNNRNNPYHIHAYFQSVLNQSEEKLSKETKKEHLQVLLEDLKNINSPSARNMYLISKAKYQMEIEGDLDSVELVLDEALSEFAKDNTYLLLFQVDFYARKVDLKGLESTRKYMKKQSFDRPDSNYYNDYLKTEVFINAIKHNESEWKNNLSKMTISDVAKENIGYRALRLMKNN